MHAGDDLPQLPGNGGVPPLAPEMQDRLKALIQQLRGALQRHQLSPEVEAEISKLVGDLELAHNPRLLTQLVKTALEENSLPAALQQELGQMLQQEAARHRANELVQRIRDSLRSRAYSKDVQSELARLLTLLPYIGRNPELMDEFDLAIVALTSLDSGSASGQEPNLRLAGSLRRHLSAKLQQSSNPLWSIVSVSGSPHNRLVSGLSWFLMIFAMLPTLLSAALFVSGVTQQHREIAQLKADLESYQNRLASASQQVGLMTERIGSANQRLSSAPLAALLPSPSDEIRDNLSLLARQELAAQQIESTLNETQAALGNLRTQTLPQIEAALNGARAAGIQNPQQFVQTLQQQVTQIGQDLTRVQSQLDIRDPVSEQLTTALLKTQLAELRDVLNGSIATVAEAQKLMSDALLAEVNAQGATPLGSPVDTVNAERIDDLGDLAIAFVNEFLNNLSTVDLPLMLAVVATGALGSFVSVIVRANQFINKHQQLDLFFVGFFRPIVGMAFACFLVAILESGIFSSVLSISAVKPDRKIYLYVAIAFVAGFSERLIKDLGVGQTSGMLEVHSITE